MTFYQWELDICPAYGWQGGPSANTKIDQLRNRHERRLARADLIQHLFTLPFENINDDTYYDVLKSAHVVMYGMAHSFLVRDWSDDRAEMESIGVAPSGTTAVQLQKSYGIRSPGGTLIVSRQRDITKPVSGHDVLPNVTMYQADGSGNPVAKVGTYSTTSGLWTPSTSWTAGRQLWWSGGFLVPVRFANDYMPMSLVNRNGNGYKLSGSVDLIEVFGE